MPAPELFPAEMIADASARALAPAVGARALQYPSTEGDPGLRAAALPAGSTFNRPQGGMFVRARLPEGWVISFTTHVAAQIAEGLVLLRRAAAAT